MEDTENAELQVNLRKISGKLVRPGNSGDSAEPPSDSDSGAGPDPDEDDLDSLEENLGVVVSPCEEDDSEDELEDLEQFPAENIEEEPEDPEIVAIVSKLRSLDPNPAVSLLRRGYTLQPDMKENKKGIFRLGRIKLRGNKEGVRRSRSWQGFGNGLRYESVSDAGLPPPPSLPPPLPPHGTRYTPLE